MSEFLSYPYGDDLLELDLICDGDLWARTASFESFKQLSDKEWWNVTFRKDTEVEPFVQSERNLPDESTTIARRSAESR